jgi:hypothetical protein
MMRRGKVSALGSDVDAEIVEAGVEFELGRFILCVSERSD